MRYERILSYFQETPWCILEAKLRDISALLNVRAFGSDEEVARRLEEWKSGHPEAAVARRRDSAAMASVGIVPVMGTMMRRANMMSEYSGGCSTQMTAQTVDQMAQDPAISGILLDIDSPGGTYDGTPELAAAVARAAKLKPVFASANGMACSAAYWVGSQATEFCAAPSADVGSIGCIMVHVDRSEQMAKEGIKPTIVRSSENKAEENSLEPLSQGAREHMQSIVDQVDAEFVRTVSEGRGLSQAKVRDQFGKGRVFMAREAKDRGMVDRVEPVEETLARLLRKASRSAEGASAKTQIQTIREFEAFLREEGRFSHSEAKRIATEGFKQSSPRDEAPGGDVLKDVAEFVSQLKSQSRGG